MSTPKDHAILRLEVILRDGRTVESELTEEEALNLEGPNFVIPTTDTGIDRARRVAYSVVFHRIAKGTGQLILADKANRHWIIPATSILAANMLDLEGPPSRVGFGPALGSEN